jgi:uncharacterized protein (DUF433 family)
MWSLTVVAPRLPVILVPHPHVSVDPQILGGSPYVVGSRVPVRRLWCFYQDGVTVETLLKRFPQLGAARLFDALAFAFDNQEVIEADIAQEQVVLKRMGQRLPGRPKGPEQIDLPFDAVPSRGRRKVSPPARR